MIQFVIGAAAGYVFGTKAGRRRYEQIKNGYQAMVNSPATKAAVQAGRKAIANKLDPQPRMREVKDLSRGREKNNGKNNPDQPIILEPDDN